MPARLLSFKFALLVSLLFPLALTLRAQSTEADLQARLANKLVYLRGCWDNGKLHFDSTGRLLNKSGQVSFTLCGFDPTSVELENTKLVLRGKRVGLAQIDGKLKPVKLDNSIRVEIDASSSGDYAPALDAIFAFHFADMIHLLPSYWQGYIQKQFGQTTPPVATTAPQGEQPKKFDMKKTNGITPPKLIESREPQFNDFARGQKFSGNVLINLWVERDGTPSHLSIVRPLGLGLDESALAAVQQYRFEPAMQNGKPVLVELNVEVNFQIF